MFQHTFRKSKYARICKFIPKRLTWDVENSSRIPEPLFRQKPLFLVPPVILDLVSCEAFTGMYCNVSKKKWNESSKIGPIMHWMHVRPLGTSSKPRSSGECRKRAGGCDSWIWSLLFGLILLLLTLTAKVWHSTQDGCSEGCWRGNGR